MSSSRAPAERTVSSGPGVRAAFADHACLTHLEAGGVSLLMYPASPHEPGPANLHLRRLNGDQADVTPLLGPSSPGRVSWAENGPVASGTWRDLRYTVRFRLSEEAPRWYWTVELHNTGNETVTADVVLTHDPALAPYPAVRNNEYYVSQYLDLTPVHCGAAGTAIAVRQNMPGEAVPWMMIGSLRRGESWATDTRQLVGAGDRGAELAALRRPSLPAARLQHEHALIALQDAPEAIPPGGRLRTGFFGVFVADHPAATGPDDASLAVQAREDTAASAPGPFEAGNSSTPYAVPASLFSTSPDLPVRELDGAELAGLSGLAGAGRHHLETAADGTDLSWFTDDGSHVVTAAKERAVLRPHGQLLRTGDALVPDTRGLTSTVWMAGTFLSQVTRGHVGRGALLSTRRGYLGLHRAHGLRVFVEDSASPSGWALLALPSAWSVSPQECRWFYAVDEALLEVVTTAPADEHELRLSIAWRSGDPRRLLLAAHVAVGGDDGHDPFSPHVDQTVDGITVRAAARGRAAFELAVDVGMLETVGGDEALFADGATRHTPWVTLRTRAAERFELALRAGARGQDGEDGEYDENGEDLPPPETHLGEEWASAVGGAIRLGLPGDSVLAGEVRCLDTVLPWFAHNALVHYLSPRGLEQFSGGGWGTRDVCQGPVGLLTALGRELEVRDVLLRVMRAQNERGDWPQAFEFLPPIPLAGQQDSHGDVVFWPLLAVGDYLQATGDESLLAEAAPFVADEVPTEPAPVLEHLRRALDRIQEMRVPGTPLPAYGHGDWNDSLQPADPELAARLVSTWTTVLLVQALRSLASGLRQSGVGADVADRAAEDADAAHEALGSTLMVDGVLPGYAMFHDDGSVEPLVHPRDDMTGLAYGVLPWIHAISADLLTPDQARHHLDLLHEHLLGPDGARLFDQPVRYTGGPMHVFQRAEASTFWGREIGLMYTHAHLRYAEALARWGDPDRLFAALCLANPVGITDRLPQARPRQSTTYYSSSDAVFADRYDATERYAELMRGDVEVEGGWRVYSSGPGLFLRLVVETLLGVRSRGDRVELDPVLPAGLDGLTARVPLGDLELGLTFRVGARGTGTRSVTAGATALEVIPLVNPYREPGGSVSRADLISQARDGRVELVVETS